MDCFQVYIAVNFMKLFFKKDFGIQGTSKNIDYMVDIILRIASTGQPYGCHLPSGATCADR